MLRDGKDEPTPDNKFKIRRYILESQVEGQDALAYAPPTDDLPETHEHYIRHYTDNRNGRDLMMLEIGVREKAVKPKQTGDGLNDLDDDALEVAAAMAGGIEIESFRKLSKSKKIKAVRESRQSAPSHVLV